MTPPSRKSCYNFRVIKINRVVDGDTIDVTIDLGFDLYRKKELELQALIRREEDEGQGRKSIRNRCDELGKEKLNSAIAGDDDLVIRTGVGGVGKYGRSSVGCT